MIWRELLVVPPNSSIQTVCSVLWLLIRRYRLWLFVFLLLKLLLHVLFMFHPNPHFHLIEQLPTPFILLGDFNPHNSVWGSDSLRNNDNVLEEFLSQVDLCFFNDGSTTTYIQVMGPTSPRFFLVSA